jgi:DNA-binding transcriptional MerR regulator
VTRPRSTRLKRTYVSREVAAVTGLSARQLQLWEAGGLMLPTIPSRRTKAGGYTERRYSPIDLFDLLVLGELRRLGFSIQQLHTIVHVLREQFGARLYDVTGGGAAGQLLTDGRKVYARTASGEFFNLLETPAQPLLVVGDERQLKVLGGSVKGKRRTKTGRRKKKSLN